MVNSHNLNFHGSIFRLLSAVCPWHTFWYQWGWRHNCIACEWLTDFETFLPDLTYPTNLQPTTYKPTTYYIGGASVTLTPGGQ